MSLYKITEELQSIFANIEDNDGEITDEQYENLLIKKEELNEKLNSYVKAIKVWKSDADTCKSEKKRIYDVQKKYENRIERLKNAMLIAVMQFGESGKKNKFIELPTVRIYTKESTSIKIDETRVNILLTEFESYIGELVKQDVLYTGEDVDLTGILQCINANCKANYGEDFEPFTITDLTSIKVSVNTEASIYKLFRDCGYALKQFGTNPLSTTISNVTSKEEWKDAIDAANIADVSKPTLASKESNNILMIK